MANDKNNFKIQRFEGQKVRTVWSEEDQQWYFSIIDICWILADSKDYDTARKYWNKLKQRLVEEGNESVTDCHQLKLVSPKDGKRYLTDVATQPQLFRIIQSIPSKKAEPFKQWMAQVASDRLDQMQEVFAVLRSFVVQRHHHIAERSLDFYFNRIVQFVFC